MVFQLPGIGGRELHRLDQDETSHPLGVICQKTQGKAAAETVTQHVEPPDGCSLHSKVKSLRLKVLKFVPAP